MNQIRLVSITGLTCLSLSIFGCTKKEETAQTVQAKQESAPAQAPATTGGRDMTDAKALAAKSGTKLGIEDTTVGSGAIAQKGKTVKVHYSGFLLDGKKFDSSLDRNEPFTFTLGAGQVIAGWDQGFDGMKVGGKRKLYIPSDMAYGERGAGNVIPPNTPLFFEVELLGVE